MRQSRAYFRDHAVPVYLEGLKKTGITLDRIPLISEIDARLSELGWGAVPVCGFIPPAAFLDFQARRILPIAYDMRSVDHIHYTPAPDIVHEAAGHAPIIADPDYAEYLTLYASMAQKAIFSQEDMNLYEAIRVLSDLKENPDSTPGKISSAETELERRAGAVQFISEANKVARMNWWTVEYGLVGSLKDPKIYGAGLLSSVSESQNCLSDKVRKIRLSIDCVNTTYNITEPQPQLFVADDLHHLTETLKEFEGTLAYSRGGIYGLEQAKRGATVTTTALDSGAEISGRLVEFVAASSHHDQVEFLRYDGPVQLAAAGKELAGQGVKEHALGFSTPLGRWRNAAGKDPSRLSDLELRDAGLAVGKRATLAFENGFVVDGNVTSLTRHAGRLIGIKWRDCQVTRAGKTYFEPAWGDFDMAVGTTVVSVFGGPADRESYGSHEEGRATTTPGRQSPFTSHEKKAFERYAEVRRLRPSSPAHAASVGDLSDKIAVEFKDEWLLRLESIELMLAAGERKRAAALSLALLNDTKNVPDDTKSMIKQGLALAGIPD